MKTLRDVFPREFLEGEFDSCKSITFKDTPVVWERDIFSNKHDHLYWPGIHRNVHYWVILENDYAVGWNESPSIGWSFPIKKLTKEQIARYLAIP